MSTSWVAISSNALLTSKMCPHSVHLPVPAIPCYTYNSIFPKTCIEYFFPIPAIPCNTHREPVSIPTICHPYTKFEKVNGFRDALFQMNIEQIVKQLMYRVK